MQRRHLALAAAAALLLFSGWAGYEWFIPSGQRAGTGIIGPGGAVGAPEPGHWKFAMAASAADLTGSGCPKGPAGMTSSGAAFREQTIRDGAILSGKAVSPDYLGFALSTSGPAVLTTSAYGQVVHLGVDGQELTFFRMAGVNGVYHTDSRSFPVRLPNDGTGAGKVQFEIRTTSRRSIEGLIQWDNRRNCTGRYPFTLVWESELATITTILPRAGRWTLETGEPEGDCEPAITSFAGIPPTVTFSHMPDPATGDASGDIKIDGLVDSSGNLDHTVIYNSGTGTTWTGGFEEFYVGTPMNEGAGLFDYVDTPFSGWFDLDALDSSHMTGRITARSSGCSVDVPVVLTYAGT